MTRRPIEQGREAKQIDYLVEANRVRLSRASRATGAIEQVAPHGEVRKQARFLKNVADGTPVRWQEGRRVLPYLAVDRAKSLTQPVEAGDAAEHRRLAAARGSKQRRDAPRGCFERRVERKRADRAAKTRLDDLAAHHRPARATRCSISVIASMTIKAKIAMPAARILASRHCMVST